MNDKEFGFWVNENGLEVLEGMKSWLKGYSDFDNEDGTYKNTYEEGSLEWWAYDDGFKTACDDW